MPYHPMIVRNVTVPDRICHLCEWGVSGSLDRACRETIYQSKTHVNQNPDSAITDPHFDNANLDVEQLSWAAEESCWISSRDLMIDTDPMIADMPCDIPMLPVTPGAVLIHTYRAY